MHLKRLVSWEIAARMAADVVIVNAGLLTGLASRFLAILYADGPLSRDAVSGYVRDTATHYAESAPLLVAVCLLCFSAAGFYTKGRFYQSSYKLLLILQATSVAYLIFGFATYFVPGLTPHPRSSLVVAWCVTLLLSSLARLWSELWRRIVQREQVEAPSRVEFGDEKPRVLVIGGAGYIGSVLCRDLLETGCQVRVLDALFYGQDSIRDLRGRDGFDFIQGDSRDIGAVVAATRDMTAVVHLGEIVGDPASALDERLTQEINVAATRMIVEVAKGFGVQRFIYASSCSVYGASDGLLTEQSSLNPVSLYARAKIDAERIIAQLSGRGFSPTILRLATVYGMSPRPRFDLAVNVLTARAVMEGLITIHGGTQWRPFVHVRDVSRAIRFALAARPEAVAGAVFNLGSDQQNYQIGQLGQMIERLIPGSRAVFGENGSDLRNYRVSFRKIAAQLGFQPKYSVADATREIEAALRSGQIADFRDSKYSNHGTLGTGRAVHELRARRIDDLYAPLLFGLPPAHSGAKSW